MKDYFNRFIKPKLQEMREAMGIHTIQVNYVPTQATITVRSHCQHLRVEYGECANPDCRIVIEDDPRDYE